MRHDWMAGAIAACGMLAFGSAGVRAQASSEPNPVQFPQAHAHGVLFATVDRAEI
jgi:hypothetical protein